MAFPPQPPRPPSQPPPPPWLPAPSHAAPQAARGPIVVLGAALVVTLAIGAGVLFLIARDGDFPYPARWDPKVSAIAHFVERTRGHTFKHPVAIRYLSEHEFRAAVTTKSADATKADRRQAATQVAMLRALGLAQGKVDLLAAGNRLHAETILAFYSNVTKRITVRGRPDRTGLDAAHRVVLAHELTHALQDQYFDLTRMRRLGGDHKTDAVTALVEGDAREVEHAYVAALSKQDAAAYRKTDAAGSSQMDLDGVPDALLLTQQWPYDFGPALVATLRGAGGVARLDAAFRDPPLSEASVVNPLSYIDHASNVQVGRVDPPSGASRIADKGEFGFLGWYLMLAERTDAHQALRAVDGWGGDAYTLYAKAGHTCVRVRFNGRSAADTSAMHRAIDHWIATLPNGMASVEAVGGDRGSLLFDTCDPGVDARLVTHRSMDAYVLPRLRAAILAEFLAHGAPLHAAACAANRVTQSASPAQAGDPKGTFFKTAAFQRRLRAWVKRCERETNGR